MKKYRVVVSYAGAIPYEIYANSEEEAELEAENKAEALEAKEFLEALQPQHMETQVEEIDEQGNEIR